MAILTQQSSISAGLEATYATADAAGDEVPFHSALFLHIKNDDGDAVTITVLSPRLCNQGFSHPQVVTIPAGENRFIGPFAQRFIQSTNNIKWTYDDVDGVTVAAIVV